MNRQCVADGRVTNASLHCSPEELYKIISVQSEDRCPEEFLRVGINQDPHQPRRLPLSKLAQQDGARDTAHGDFGSLRRYDRGPRLLIIMPTIQRWICIQGVTVAAST